MENVHDGCSNSDCAACGAHRRFWLPSVFTGASSLNGSGFTMGMMIPGPVLFATSYVSDSRVYYVSALGTMGV